MILASLLPYASTQVVFKQIGQIRQNRQGCQKNFVNPQMTGENLTQKPELDISRMHFVDEDKARDVIAVCADTNVFY